MTLQASKALVREYLQRLDQAVPNEVPAILSQYCSSDHTCYASYPWRDLRDLNDLCARLWLPFKDAFNHMQRREDIFFAGRNPSDGKNWVLSTGHYMALFDHAWLNMPPTNKIVMIRYAEFHQVTGDEICESGVFLDMVGVMRQAGYDPLPNETGKFFTYPGPKTNDGVLLEAQPAHESEMTSKLLDTMVDDLDQLNRSGNDECPPELLARTWSEDMVWYGPAGIGASMSIQRYQEQHQHPFRQGLTNKVFNGHICRIAEGHYAGFFGWPNLHNSAAGFLGVESNDVHAEMQVVDVYRREGNKLAENWVIIDLPWWLKQQGIDVFDDMEAYFSQ